MMAEVGHPVVELVRRQFGPLHLGTLPVGQMRDLTKVELGQLLTISRAQKDRPVPDMPSNGQRARRSLRLTGRPSALR